jgi:transcription elongation factor Elf1
MQNRYMDDFVEKGYGVLISQLNGYEHYTDLVFEHKLVQLAATDEAEEDEEEFKDDENDEETT